MPENSAAPPAEEPFRACLAALKAENARLTQQLKTALQDAARFHAILESATDYAIFTTDPAGRVTSWNAGAKNLLGWDEAEALGMDARLTFVPEDRERGAPEAEMAKAAVEGRAGNERWHLRQDGSRFWGSGILVPLRGDHEQGFLKVMRDRTARREGDERQRLLLEELAHRVKNTLTVVLSIARRSGDRADDLASFLKRFEGRLMALAAVHDLLSESGWLGVQLAPLVRLALAPHDGDGDGRIRAEIEDVLVRPAPAQDLVLVLHELAVNATKHGALSVPGSTVSVEIRSQDEDLVLAWRETGGPPVTPPLKQGFGTTLLAQAVAHQQGGRLELDWRPEGLACTIRLPLAEITAQLEASGS